MDHTIKHTIKQMTLEELDEVIALATTEKHSRSYFDDTYVEEDERRANILKVKKKVVITSYKETFESGDYDSGTDTTVKFLVDRKHLITLDAAVRSSKHSYTAQYMLEMGGMIVNFGEGDCYYHLFPNNDPERLMLRFQELFGLPPEEVMEILFLPFEIDELSDKIQEYLPTQDGSE